LARTQRRATLFMTAGEAGRGVNNGDGSLRGHRRGRDLDAILAYHGY
jgi:hypothetical protein